MQNSQNQKAKYQTHLENFVGLENGVKNVYNR